MNAATQFIIALGTLIAAVAGLVNSFRNSSKIKDVAAVNATQSDKLDAIKVQTDGLSDNLVNATLQQGKAEGMVAGVAQERAVAKDLLNNSLKKESI